MFLEGDFRGRGEPQQPRKHEFGKSSKGYPAQRDPQAENPKGVLPANLSQVELYKYRQRYALG